MLRLSKPRHLAFWIALSGAPLLYAQQQASPPPGQGDQMNARFQSALAHYRIGKFAEAASELELLLSRAPQSYELHELLGLTYAAESEKQKSVEQLSLAVDVKPASGLARTNLATALVRQGRSAEAEEQFKKALTLDPANYSANHNLAEFYLQSKQLSDAVPLLKEAYRLDPNAYDNSYDLASAEFLNGQLDDAQTLVQDLLKQKDTGELHNLAGQIDEKGGRFLEAAKQFESAAQVDPSEDNLFAWGSELLLHRTYDPAIQVFHQAAERYPSSPRLWIGLGMAQYSQGKYEDATKSLLKAADLDPTDARCYLFLSRAYLSSPKQAEDVIRRFHTYAQIQPGNALAQYYYAMGLWKGRRTEADAPDFTMIAMLLNKSIALDGKIADAHLQLGILYATQHDYQKAYPEYTRALELDPKLADVHFRLGQYYARMGDKERGQQEFEIYRKLHAQYLAKVEKERAEVQQFVYSAQNTSARQP